MNELKISQNFLKDKSIINRILKDKTSIDTTDVVFDIGSGEGIITEVLLNICSKIYTFEKDEKLYQYLKDKYENNSKVIINKDFLEFNITDDKYKVFSNIPFSISSEILNKLLFNNNKPIDSYIFLEKGTAYRYLGLPYKKESILSIRIKSNYVGSLIHQFNKFDFNPVPNADIVLVRFKRVNIDNNDSFLSFIESIFNAKKHNLKNSLEIFFTYNQIKRIKKDLKLDLKSNASDIEYNKWVEIFNIYNKLNSSN